MTPSVPAATPMSTLPAITACMVSPLPLVNSSSRSRSCLRKMPARSPSAAGAPCHISRCPTAILSLSAAKAGMVASHPAMAAARQIPTLWITAALIAVAASAPWKNLRARRRPRKRLLGIRVVMEKPRSSRGVGQEFQGHAVDAVAQSRGRRAVLEDMAQMSAAAPAMHLGAWQQQQVVGGGANGVPQRPIEARPAGLAVVFGFRREQRKIAARAGKRALALLVVERARARGFGAVPPQDVVLRLAEDGSPLAVVLLDFKAVGGLHVGAPQRAKPRDQRQHPRTRQQATTIGHGLSPSCPTAPRAGRRVRN